MSSRRSNLRNFGAESTTNAGLWLQKFLFTQEKNQDNTKKSHKQNLVDEVSQIKVPQIYVDFYKNIWEKSFENIEKRLIEISGRMIVGLGAESVLETSITLHRTFGVPFIPGSALKGLAASYAHRFMGEDWKKTNKETKKIGKAHELMFGSQDSAGYVIFYDALYIPNSYQNKPSNPLETDILTVHHQKYYQGEGDAPADWDSPVPIPLLSAQGKYLLAVSANSGDEIFDKKLTNLAIEILGLALEQEGIGAKTSSGYGHAVLKPFEELQDLPALENSSIESNKSTETKVVISEEVRVGNKLKLLENIKNKLAAISDYEKASRNKLKEIVKDDLKRLDGELKKQGAMLIVETARKFSQKDDGFLEGAEWFVEAKRWL